MREMTGPAMTPLPATAHLLSPLLRWAADDPNKPIAAYRDGDDFTTVSARVFLQRVRTIAKGLVASGVNPGDRVALMSRTRLEWSLIDYGILAAGAVTVPIYETSSAAQVEWVLSNSGAIVAVAETAEMAGLVETARSGAPECRETLVIDEGALEILAERGQEITDEVVDQRIGALSTSDIASIVYTSGTTGRPKGCVLTHGNLRTNTMQTMDAVGSMLQPTEVILLFLPLAHVLSRIIALVAMEGGATLAYATDLRHLPEELPLAQPTMITAVPRVFEKVYNEAQHQAHTTGKAGIFARAEEVAIQWSINRNEGRFDLMNRLQHAVFNVLVYGKVRAAFGGRLRFAFSGGGPLGERLTHFFNGIGVRIFEGYGLTETSPILTVNRDGAWRPGTVGKPVANTTIGIAEDGEILAQGPQVFAGYWGLDEEEAGIDADGWFHTGDVGELDTQGYLKITGRKKEIIVTAAGKNVAPAPLEDHLRAHPLISQALVVGDQRPFVAAVLTLDDEALPRWAADHGKPGATAADLVDDPQLRAELQRAVDAANATVSRAESIREFRVLPSDLTIEAGELTPTLKVRREVVTKSYDQVIEDIYGR